MANFVLIAITIVIAGLRFVIVPRLDLPTAEGSYEAFAHLFVGALFGAWLAMWRGWKLREPGYSMWLWLGLASAVSLLELVMFVIQKTGC
jgi:hypothetical protein